MFKRKQIVALTAFVLAVSLLGGCVHRNIVSDDVTEPANSAQVESTDSVKTKEELGMMEIKTKYLSLRFPEKYSKYLVHQETAEDGATAEVFTMKTSSSKMELFRIYFGDAHSGSYLGSLRVNDMDVPVTVLPAVHEESEFANEDDRALYYDMMDCLNVVLDSFYKDTRFDDSSSVNHEDVKREDAEVAFWNFSLPTGIEWEEGAADGYLVTFYGTLGGERHELYSVSVGGKPLRTIIGTYIVDGEAEIVSVQSAELPNMEGWDQETENQLYSMMESINDVIQTILESEGFEEYAPEDATQ
jgi:hypothetical protein